jgi:MFS family permease
MAISLAGLGYASFALLVTVARFGGGALITRLGAVRVVVIGAILAATGLAVSILTDHWLIALFGYALCGLGCANISPVLISSLNRQQDMPVHLAVTAATTVGFAGVLAGPALIGLVAHLSSLAVAFALVAVLLLGMLFSTSRLPR